MNRPRDKGFSSVYEVKVYIALIAVMPLQQVTATAPLMLPMPPPLLRRHKFALARCSRHSLQPYMTGNQEILTLSELVLLYMFARRRLDPPCFLLLQEKLVQHV